MEEIEKLKRNNKTLLTILIVLIIIEIIVTTLTVIEIYKYNNIGVGGCSVPYQMSQLEVQEFNGKLEVGIGEKVIGSNVKTMLEVIDEKKRDNDELDLAVDFIEPLQSAEDISSTSRYAVTGTKNEDTGMYNVITIRKASNQRSESK